MSTVSKAEAWMKTYMCKLEKMGLFHSSSQLNFSPETLANTQQRTTLENQWANLNSPAASKSEGEP